MDKETSKNLIANLKKLSDSLLIIIVSHKFIEIQCYADIIIEVSNNKITKIDTKENTSKIKSNGNNIFNLHKSLFKYTLRRMRNNCIPIILKLILLITSLSVLFVSNSIINLDLNKVEVKNLINNKKNRISIYFDSDDVDKLRLDKNVDSLQFVYSTQSVSTILDIQKNQYNQNIYYKGYYDNQKFVEINDNTFNENDQIYGRLPSEKNEIIITEYLYECIKDLGINISSKQFYPTRMEEILNKKDLLICLKVTLLTIIIYT